LIAIDSSHRLGSNGGVADIAKHHYHHRRHKCHKLDPCRWHGRLAITTEPTHCHHLYYLDHHYKPIAPEFPLPNSRRSGEYSNSSGGSIKVVDVDVGVDVDVDGRSNKQTVRKTRMKRNAERTKKIAINRDNYGIPMEFPGNPMIPNLDLCWLLRSGGAAMVWCRSACQELHDEAVGLSGGAHLLVVCAKTVLTRTIPGHCQWHALLDWLVG
jgi:hypothetical protein